MSLPSSAVSRLPRLFLGGMRSMHSGGRPIAHPPQGGAGSSTGASGTSPGMPKAADGLLAPGEGSTSTPDVNNAGASSLPIEENAERSKRPTSWPTESTKSADLPPVEDYSVITERSLEGKMVRYHVSPEGKRTLIPDDVRPPRRTIVQMASGYPEPHVWPPTRRAQNKRDELHPLYKFFKIQPEALVCVNESEDPNEWKSSPPKVGALPDVDIEVFTGQSWSVKLLRLKSFQDLHTLWYLLLRERNLIATQLQEKRRLRVSPGIGAKAYSDKRQKVQRSMAAIKAVLHERRLGVMAAVSPYIGLDSEAVHPHDFKTDPGNTHDALYTKPELANAEWKDIRIPAATLRAQKAKHEQRCDQQPGEEEEQLEESATTPTPTSEAPAAASEGNVGKLEVESKDEGFGGGKEAEEFVRETKI